jgi:hypothetical protein
LSISSSFLKNSFFFGWKVLKPSLVTFVVEMHYLNRGSISTRFTGMQCEEEDEFAIFFLSKKCINKNCCKLRSWVYFFMNFCLHEFLAIFWIFNSSKNKAFLVFNIYFGKEQLQRKYGNKVRNIFCELI